MTSLDFRTAARAAGLSRASASNPTSRFANCPGHCTIGPLQVQRP